MKKLVVGMALAALALPGQVQASQAYGSLNNFDVVNDTGEPCHGFEIELEDVHSSDITYTYDYNHYGTPVITEDNSDPAHPRVRVRYEAKPLPEGGWSAYTAVPAGPVAPTDGHMFTDPTVNFGGEHFGVGFYGLPTTVRYFWLRDDGFGNLVRGNMVEIATPTFAYAPPVGVAPPAVQAVIEPPEEEYHFGEFGEPVWVKVTRTTSHNNGKVELRDLVSDDPEDPDDRNWRNGEPDEVESEWELMQQEYNQDDGGPNGKIESEPEELGDEDEVVTRRYEFFKYIGPLDPENGEALCDEVAADGIHGVGTQETDEGVIDFSTIEVVGEYIGAQMAGFDPEGKIGLIDNLQAADLGQPYVDRRVVIGGVAPVVTTTEGELPEGMSFDEVEGILSGTPLVAGAFSFSVHSVDSAGGDVSKTYELRVKDGSEGEGLVEGILEGEGVVEGSPEGVVEGSPEGVVEGSPEGVVEGSPEGVVEGSPEGVVEGSPEGVVEGSPEGIVEGSPEGSVEGSQEGVIEGSLEGEQEDGEVEEGEQEDEVHQLLEAFDELDDSEDDRIEYEEAQVLLPTLTPEQFDALDTNGDGELNVAELLAAAGGNQVIHGGDTDGDRKVELGELLRIIQLYNARAYSCLANPGDSEDGYAPGDDDTPCVLPHAADYDGAGPDGVIDLSELLRVIQFFSTGGYNYCPQGGTEDGFCAGPVV